LIKREKESADDMMANGSDRDVFSYY
jgi:hypothetical protein